MKRLFYLLAIVSVMLCSCNSEEADNKVQKEELNYVTLDFGMSQDYAPITRGTTPTLAEMFSCLKICLISTTNDADRIYVSQSNTDAHFGSVTVGVPNKSYFVWACGCAAEPTIADNHLLSYPNNKVADTFVKYIGLNPTQTSSLTIDLSRAVGKFVLTLTDTSIPSAVTKIRLKHSGGSARYELKNGCHNYDDITTVYTEDYTDFSTMSFEFLTFADMDNSHINETKTEKLTVVVEALDANDAVLETRTFENVPMHANYVTTYTGKLFSDYYVPFTINVSSEWTGNYNKTF